jgi:dGTPase
MRDGTAVELYRERGLPHAIAAHNSIQDLELWSFASVEAQIAAIADDIAYDAHDIDDGLRAGLFVLEDLAGVPLIRDSLADIRAQHPALDPSRVVHELVRRLITRMIEDVIAETGARLRALAPCSADDVRHAAQPVGGFSPAMAEADRAIKGFLYPRMYRHSRIMRIMGDAERLVCDLFRRYLEQPGDMPAEWAQLADGADEAARLRHIADFIAGMTDRYALVEHARLFDSTPELR